MVQVATGAIRSRRYLRASSTGLLGLGILVASTSLAGTRGTAQTALFTQVLQVDFSLELRHFNALARSALDWAQSPALAKPGAGALGLAPPTSADGRDARHRLNGDKTPAFSENFAALSKALAGSANDAMSDADVPTDRTEAVAPAGSVSSAQPAGHPSTTAAPANDEFANAALSDDETENIAPVHQSMQFPAETVLEASAPAIVASKINNETIGAAESPLPLVEEIVAVSTSVSPPEVDQVGAKEHTPPARLAALELPSDAALNQPIAPMISSSSPLPAPELFGSVAISAVNAPIGVMSRKAILEGSEKSGSDRLDAVWQETLQQARKLNGIEQISWLNERVNELVEYRTDSEAHGVPERWSTAQETMERRSGDCEDYAILKMWMLRQLAFKSEDMFVVVVLGSTFDTQHAVLAVRSGDSTFVLDNRTDALLEDKEIRGYHPLYSTNEHGLWIHGSRMPLKLSARI